MAPRLRIFLSSPGDVREERLRAHLVIQKLARDYARFFAIEPFLWEYEPMLASKHFQDAIDPPASFDIVVLVLWSRLGTALPEKTEVREYRGIDGRAPVTGTEWEFEDALRANRAHNGKGPPDLLAYRRIGGAVAELDDAAARDEKIRQYDALEAFWRRWFKSDHQFLAGYAEYAALDEFDRRLEADLAKLIERRIKERSLAEGAALWLKGSPFRGLEAYGFADAPVFFGREGETREGVTRLAEAASRGTAFLLVTGASGAGKSSLARAGLLPALTATRAVADVGLWRRAVMRPGDAGGEPVLALARALLAGDPAKGEGLTELAGAHMTAEELAAHLSAGGDTAFLFTKTLRELADAERVKRALLPHEEVRLVLLIDQLEELFTRPEIAAAQRTRFGAVIAALARSGVVWVIATMRSDIAYRLDEVKDLGELSRSSARLVLTPPDAAQLLEIIRQSARAAGLAFDTDAASGLGLDAMLAREAAAEPGVLPLLSVMLDDLYGRDVATGLSGGVLTVASYRALGGLRAAIGERAERKLQSLEASDAVAAQALPAVLRALVTAGAASDAPAMRPVPLATFADGSAERRLIEALLAPDARLLTVEDRGKGSELRLAHEALIENWPRAKRIIGDAGNFIRVRDDVEAQRRKWERAKRRSEFLLARGLPLAEADDLVAKFSAELSPDVLAFIARSLASAKAAARRRWVVAVIVMVALAGLTAASLGGLYFAESQRNDALIAQSRFVARDSWVSAGADEPQQTSDSTSAMLTALAVLPPDIAHPVRPFVREAAYALENGLANQREHGVLQHPAIVDSAEYSPDGSRVATGARDGIVRLWKIALGDAGMVSQATSAATELTGHDPGDVSVAFSPDGMRIASASADKTVRVWDVTSGTQLLLLKGHTGQVYSVAFSPDGSRLVSASADGTARLWDAQTGAAGPVLQGHTDVVYCAEFSPDGSRVVTASGDNTMRVWNVAGGAAIMTITGHSASVVWASFSPDGKRIASAAWDNTARIWNAEDGTELGQLKGHGALVTRAVYSHDGGQILTSSYDGTARLWDADSGDQIAILQGQIGALSSAAFSPDGERVITAGQDGTAAFFITAPASEILVMAEHQGAVASSRFSPDGHSIVTAGADQTARIWDAQTGATRLVLTGHSGAVTSAVFSPDGSRVATASMDKTGRVWDAKTGALLLTLTGHGAELRSIAFSPDGKRIVTASADQTAWVWDGATGAQLLALRGHQGAVWSAAFSPDGSRIVTASWDKTARIWDAATGSELKQLVGHSQIVLWAAFSPDGNKVATASGDLTSRVWNAATGTSIALLGGHQDIVTTAVFSPDGRRVLTASLDATVRTWDATTGDHIAVFRGHAAEVDDAAFAPDGNTFVSASKDSTARVWLVPPRCQAMIDTAQEELPRQLSGGERDTEFLQPSSAPGALARLFQTLRPWLAFMLPGAGESCA